MQTQHLKVMLVILCFIIGIWKILKTDWI